MGMLGKIKLLVLSLAVAFSFVLNGNIVSAQSAAPKMIGDGNRPVICAPLVGANREAILAELEKVLAKSPDMIEWRVDFFEGVTNQADVISMAKEIKSIAGNTPIIFTLRAVREGGHATPLTDAQMVQLDAAVCQNTNVEYLDYELSNTPENIRYLRQAALNGRTKLIGSYHNFTQTPGREFLAKKFTEAEKYGFDVAKVAVMPQREEDVLTLLSATLEAKNRLKIPLITMSMGKYGVVSRMIGGVFGSSLSFAVGASSSAPGQIPIDDLREVLTIIDRAMGNNN